MGSELRIGITCYPTFGGSGIIATEIGQSLARRGHRVHFICYDVPGRLDRFAPNVFFHGVEVRDYPLFQESPYALALASKMVEVARYEKLDLLHVHYAIPHATSAYLAKQILGTSAPRVITTLHGTDSTLVGSDPAFLPITRFSILQSDRITVPSHYLERATRANLDIPAEVPIEVIGNFVDVNRFKPTAQRRWATLRHLFDRADRGGAPAIDASGERPRILVHNSNFRPLKRVDDVVRIFAEVRRAIPALLVLIGDGPERSRVERLARDLGLADTVCFLGNQLDFVEVLAHADLFLLPSGSESFGLAALEALACGVPVVASRIGGVPEVVREGETGLLFEVGDVEGMAAGARRILEDSALHQRMALAARATAERDFPRERTIDQYEDCYRRVLG
jgi:N-acetyl-alpha-D-glucosaminyl L-malate synthase BshA